VREPQISSAAQPPGPELPRHAHRLLVPDNADAFDAALKVLGPELSGAVFIWYNPATRKVESKHFSNAV